LKIDLPADRNKKMIYWILVTMLVVAVAQSPEQRAKELVAKMTLDEKLGAVHGYPGGPWAGHVVPISHLNVPTLYLLDGPQGVADGVKLVTCWPSTLTVVSSWDIDLMKQYGIAIGKEQRLKGVNIALGPMVNLARVAFGGRNFESYVKLLVINKKIW
jgi:beta-glucosidase